MLSCWGKGLLGHAVCVLHAIRFLNGLKVGKEDGGPAGRVGAWRGGPTKGLLSWGREAYLQQLFTPHTFHTP